MHCEMTSEVWHVCMIYELVGLVESGILDILYSDCCLGQKMWEVFVNKIFVHDVQVVVVSLLSMRYRYRSMKRKSESSDKYVFQSSWSLVSLPSWCFDHLASSWSRLKTNQQLVYTEGLPLTKTFYTVLILLCVYTVSISRKYNII